MCGPAEEPGTGHCVTALWAVHLCEKNLISAEAFEAARRHALVFSVKSILHRGQLAPACCSWHGGDKEMSPVEARHVI